MAGDGFFRNLIVNPFRSVLRTTRRIDRRPDNRGQKAPGPGHTPPRRDLGSPEPHLPTGGGPDEPASPASGDLGELLDWKDLAGPGDRQAALDQFAADTLAGRFTRKVGGVELPVTSSWIASIQWDPIDPGADVDKDPNAKGILRIRKRPPPDSDGLTMKYTLVPFSYYDDMYAAGSKGEFFNMYIRNNPNFIYLGQE